MRLLMTVLLLSAIWPATSRGADWGPWEVPKKSQAAPDANDPGALQQAVRLFQKHISPVDGPRCPMYPTCSAYSLQALHKHGPAFGVFLTVDRLYREGDPHERQQPIEKWGFVRFYDPLENNDFWLTPSN